MTFQAIDTNYDGSLSKEELTHMLKNLSEYVSDQQIDDMIRKADENNDGSI
jgi:calmodulin